MGVHVIEGNIENIAKQVHTDFQVILGWASLSQSCIAIDYAQLTLQWSDALLDLGTAKWKTGYAVVNNAPVVDGVIDGKQVRFLLDTWGPRCTIDASLVAKIRPE